MYVCMYVCMLEKLILRGIIFKFHLIAVLINLYFIIFLVLVLNLARNRSLGFSRNMRSLMVCVEVFSRSVKGIL